MHDRTLSANNRSADLRPRQARAQADARRGYDRGMEGDAAARTAVGVPVSAAVDPPVAVARRKTVEEVTA